MKITEIAAWWGAVIATFVLLWDIYKWKRSGPIIKISVTPNLKVYPSDPLTNNKTWIHIMVTNSGNQPTTLTNLCGFYYKSRFQKFR